MPDFTSAVRLTLQVELFFCITTQLFSLFYLQEGQPFLCVKEIAAVHCQTATYHQPCWLGMLVGLILLKYQVLYFDLLQTCSNALHQQNYSNFQLPSPILQKYLTVQYRMEVVRYQNPGLACIHGGLIPNSTSSIESLRYKMTLNNQLFFSRIH